MRQRGTACAFDSAACIGAIERCLASVSGRVVKDARSQCRLVVGISAPDIHTYDLFVQCISSAEWRSTPPTHTLVLDLAR